MQMYSLNRVVARNYLKFLQLLGTKPRGVDPPRVDVMLLWENIRNSNAFWIQKGTKLKPDPSEHPDITYEISQDKVCLTPFTIRRIVAQSASEAIDIDNAPTINGRYFYPFGDNPIKDNCFYLGLDGLDPDDKKKCFCQVSSGIPDKIVVRPAKISLGIYLYDQDLPALVEDECTNELKVQVSSRIKWEYSTKNDRGSWHWLRIQESDNHELQDDTKELSRSGRVSFIIPFKSKDRRNLILNGMTNKEMSLSEWAENVKYKKADDRGLFWLRCTLVKSDYEIPPRIDAIIPNTVSASFGETIDESLIRINDNSVEDERLDGGSVEKDASNGLPNQIFKIEQETRGFNYRKHLPIIEVISIYTIVAGDDVQWKYCVKWHEVSDLNASSPFDYHYILNRAEGEVTFGNGERGRIPTKRSRVKMRYRYGQITDGAQIKPGTSFSTIDVNTLNQIPNIVGKNVFAPSQGHDYEKVEDALARTRRSLNTPTRAVSSADYQYIAMHTPGLRVARVEVLPSSQPRSNIVKMVVIPYYNSKIPSLPSQGFLRTMEKHINYHRLITTKVLVLSPIYVGLSINCTLELKSAFDSNVVMKKICDSLDDLLRPFYIRADDKKAAVQGTESQGWSLGRAVYKSEIYAMIATVGGVGKILELSLVISKSGDQKTNYDKDGNVVIGETSLVYLESCSITVK